MNQKSCVNKFWKKELARWNCHYTLPSRNILMIMPLIIYFETFILMSSSQFTERWFSQVIFTLTDRYSQQLWISGQNHISYEHIKSYKKVTVGVSEYPNIDNLDIFPFLFYLLFFVLSIYVSIWSMGHMKCRNWMALVLPTSKFVSRKFGRCLFDQHWNPFKFWMCELSCCRKHGKAFVCTSFTNAF